MKKVHMLDGIFLIAKDILQNKKHNYVCGSKVAGQKGYRLQLLIVDLSQPLLILKIIIIIILRIFTHWQIKCATPLSFLFSFGGIWKGQLEVIWF